MKTDTAVLKRPMAMLLAAKSEDEGAEARDAVLHAVI
jgi:hypothetical protein